MSKKILFIGLSYFNYPSAIKKKLEEKGFDVKYHAIEPRTFIIKALRYIHKGLYNKRIDNYHKSIIEEERQVEYDYVFFLTVHFFSHTNIQLLKESQPQAIYLLYNWDPVNVYDYRPYLNYFNKSFTFDIENAKELNINYLPLFAIDSYFDMRHKQEYKYDVYTVGTIVTYRRYYHIEEFIKYCEINNIQFITHLKCTLVTYIRVLLKGRRIPKNLKFHAIDSDRFFEIVKNSKAVFDFSNHVQSGYTMRIAENLCAGKQIITNNKYIRDESFYDENMIFIYSDTNFENVDKFLKNKTKRHINFDEWSLGNWIDKLLHEEERVGKTL